VKHAIRRLGLSAHFTAIRRGARGASSQIEPAHRPIDLIFNDAGDYAEFAKEYWPLLNPNNGLMIFHNTTGAWAGNTKFVERAKRGEFMSPAEFEVISLVEPHKLNQQSFTIFRKKTGVDTRSLEDKAPTVLATAATFLDRRSERNRTPALARKAATDAVAASARPPITESRAHAFGDRPRGRVGRARRVGREPKT